MKGKALFVLCLLAICARSLAQQPKRSQNVQDFIDDQETVVKEIAEEMANLYSDRRQQVRECECSLHACGAISSNSTCLTQLGTPDICQGHEEGQLMDNTTSMIRTPPGVTPETLSAKLNESICVYQHLDDTFRRIGTKEVGWMYVGTTDGHHRRYPATAGARSKEHRKEPFNGCNPFDPRLRPWYIAASTGPKDIVLVVDKSGSMDELIGTDSDTTKWKVTKQAVSDILDTFTPTDFVNVVPFADEAEPLWPGTAKPQRNEKGLVRGEFANLQELKDALEKVVPDGNTSFKAAFDTAFRLLTENCDADSRRSCSKCHKIILFLTDGSDTSSSQDGGRIKPSEMLNLIDGLQETLEDETGSRAAIFTFSMTEKADDAIPRQIACSNEGAWSFIDSDTNTLDALNSYTQYLANGRRSPSPIWTEPFEDFAGLGNVTTVALPVYANGTGNDPDIFIGVAGHDILLDELSIDGLDHDTILDLIIDRSENCTESRNGPCDLQVFRSQRNETALCPDIFATNAGRRIGNSDNETSDVCYEHNQFFYKRFSEEVHWGRAVNRCKEDGGELVTIRAREELAFVANLASLDGSWIGLESYSQGDNDLERSFRWLDGRDDLPRRSPFWGIGEPPSVSEKNLCGAIDPRGIIANLFSKACSEELSFLCKYENNSTCTTEVRSIDNPCPALEDSESPPDSEDIRFANVLCDLSDPGKETDAFCCPSKDDGLSHTMVIILIVLGSTGVFFSILCIAIFSFRDRMSFICCRTPPARPK